MKCATRDCKESAELSEFYCARCKEELLATQYNFAQRGQAKGLWMFWIVVSLGILLLWKTIK